MEWHITDPADARRLREQRRYFGISNVKKTTVESIELAKNFGKLAAEEVIKLLSEPFVIYTAFADGRGDGKHKRYYAFVQTGDGQDLASILVSRGLARAIGVVRQTHDGRSQSEYKEHLRDLELQAASKRLGIWQATNWDSLPDERRMQRDEDRQEELAFDGRKFQKGERINPNTAARDELMRLPGIGEVLANEIISARPFKKIEDLERVSGIGPAKIEKMKPYLELPNTE
jgi:competence ComEA-like helix-hairpin-helix protein